MSCHTSKRRSLFLAPITLLLLALVACGDETEEDGGSNNANNTSNNQANNSNNQANNSNNQANNSNNQANNADNNPDNNTNNADNNPDNNTNNADNNPDNNTNNVNNNPDPLAQCQAACTTLGETCGPNFAELCPAEVLEGIVPGCQEACQNPDAQAQIIQAANLPCDVVVPLALDGFGLSEVCDGGQPDAEVCGDDQDNDGDGDTDCDDSDCANDAACGNPDGPAPIADPGQSITINSALDAGDPTWVRPDEGEDNTCAENTSEEEGQYPYELHEIVNNTGASQKLRIQASWAEDNDGYLLVYGAPFTPSLDACVAADDDYNGQEASLLFNIDISAGQTLTLVASTFSTNEPLGAYSFAVTTQLPDAPEVCGDGLDNDNDGDADCADFDCDEDASCVELCDDGQDNDDDGQTDCDDFDCFGADECVEVCNDQVDNDDDEDVDCADFDCEFDEACAEVCDDDQDNDGDGATDCDDAACGEAPGCVEICGDQMDNNGDGDVDCSDSDCIFDEACVEICDDEQDNDGDGNVDCADFYCFEDPVCF